MPGIDPRQLAALFERHAPALVLYARQRLAARDAEDAVQEVFVSLARQPRVPIESRAWLYKAVRQRVFGRRRARYRREKRHAASSERAPRWFETTPGQNIDAEHAQSLLEQLPLNQREAVVLRIWGHLTLEEIADVISCSTSAAHRRYHTGIETLRKQMGVTCPGEDRSAS